MSSEPRNIPDYYNHPDIEANETYYQAYFVPNCPRNMKSFKELNEQELSDLQSDIEDPSYLEWLKLSAEQLRANPKILQNMHNWIRRQEYIAYISITNNKIVDAYRDPIQNSHNTLNRNIRTRNNQYIAKLDRLQQAEIELIQAYSDAANRMPQLRF